MNPTLLSCRLICLFDTSAGTLQSTPIHIQPNTIAPPPIDRMPTVVEIRKADVGRSRSVKLRTPHASIDDNMADTCDEVITIRLARDGSAACRGGSGKVTHKDWNLGPAGYI
jgi:hypothetical protein